MDLFLINGHDGVSISDMIDWDIKLSDSDLSEEVGVNNLLGVGYELPSLETEDEPGSLWPQTYCANSNSSFELDLLGVEGAASMMVEPSSVMPFVSRRPPLPAAAPASYPEHSTDSKLDLPEAPVSPPPIKIDQVFQLDYKDEEGIKIEVVDEEDSEGDHSAASESVDLEESFSLETDENAQPQSIMTLPIEFINVTSAKYVRVVEPAKKVKKRQVTPSSEFEVKKFPKPAYSYSCLIAMALKNSPTGSLPVSEIYSFMCHHFPYFKTAPSGWKNSVRHNLSLNKCFEKIEKPHFNGGSHRKGCLWGLNPAKKTKMDEEVAKWTKKDPFSIKSAMVYPEYLELLERGEMKDEAAFLVPEATEEDQEDIKEGDEFGIDVEDDRISPIDDDSEDEISRVPPSLQPFEPKFANISRYTLAESKNASNTSRNVKKEIVDEYEFLDVEGEEVDNDSQSDGCVADESTRAFLGLDDSTPIYAVDPSDENVLIELPLIKKPRVQANYIYGPAVNMKRHNISGFRSLKIKSP